MRTGLILALVLAGILPSCREETEEGEPTRFSVEKKRTSGPVTVITRVSRDRITIADSIQIEVEAVSEPGWEIELPAFADDTEAFSVSDRGTYGPEVMGNGKTRRGRRYKLEPFLMGDAVIPPLTISFSETGREDPQEYSITTEEIKIHVGSVTGADGGKAEDINPIKGVLSIPASVWPWLAVAAALVSAAIIVVILSSRKKEAHIPPPPPPHITALERLKRLANDNLIAQGLVDEFYVRLSDIIRRYIEDRFALRAPEKTTEEFLQDVSSGNILQKQETDLLERFLTHCDMVKFARHDPTRDEIDESFDSADTFIQKTRIGVHDN